MKKFLLGIFAFALTTQLSFSQCVPDMSHAGDVGIHPDSATNFDPAYVGTPYEQVITSVVPVDTCVQVLPLPFPCTTLSFDSVNVVSITGLPPGFTYACAVPNCSFPGNSIDCAVISGTAQPGDEGTYPLVITLDGYVGSLGVPNTFTLTYYRIVVLPALSVDNTNESFFEVAPNKPNPFEETTQINFSTANASTVSFEVFNLIGQSVYSQKVNAARGKNTINFNGADLPTGTYIYKLSDGNKMITRKMIISR